MTAVRTLVVDDHPVVRAGIVALLTGTDRIDVVGEAGDGAAALDLVGRLRPKVVLMDLQMPVLDGVGATERITREHPETSVLVLTTYEDDTRILDAIGAGASGYLVKTAPTAEIVAGIEAVARGGTVLAPSIAAALVGRIRDTAPVPSARELEVLALVADGLSNPDIARQLVIAESTVKTHLLHVFEKLGVSDRTRAVTLALERGLLPRR